MCHYKVKNGLGITEDWLATEICPNIAGAFDKEVAAILAKPLLWAAYDPSMKDQMHIDMLTSTTRKIT